MVMMMSGAMTHTEGKTLSTRVSKNARVFSFFEDRAALWHRKRERNGQCAHDQPSSKRSTSASRISNTVTPPTLNCSQHLDASWLRCTKLISLATCGGKWSFALGRYVAATRLNRRVSRSAWRRPKVEIEQLGRLEKQTR